MNDDRECNVNGCTRNRRARGYCSGHYLRWRRTGDPGPADFRKIEPDRTCSVDGCDRPYMANNLCSAHNQQAQAGKTPGKIRRAKGSSAERDELGRKWCSTGKHWTDTSDFATSKDTVDGLLRRCTTCMKLRKFGLTRAQYAAMLDAQGGVCAICGQTNPNGNALSVDHDHRCCPGKRSCGKCNRGLLCTSCNAGLGLLGDSHDRLASASWYLRKHGH